jgi:hypothetical protein
MLIDDKDYIKNKETHLDPTIIANLGSKCVEIE